MNPQRRPLAVVTGASSGVGRQTAIDLAGCGHDLVLVARDESRMAETAAAAHASDAEAHVQTRRVDLSELDEVRALAAHLVEMAPDVVVSNAALVAPLDVRNSEGIWAGLAVNHLAPYLLIRSLSEQLGSQRIRFIIVGGLPTALRRTPVDLDELDPQHPRALGWPPSLRPAIAYGRTKSMNLMFINGLDARLPPASGVTINGAHPGIIPTTRLNRHDRRAARAFGLISGAMTSDTVEEAAARMVWLATAPEMSGRSGTYVVGRSFADTPWHTRDPERVDRLWRESAKLVGLQP